MNLCFFGKSDPAREWLALLRNGGGHSITHCTDGGQVLSVLRGTGPAFDWLLLEGQETAGEGAAVARAVRAMGYGVPIAFLGFGEPPGARDGPMTAVLRVAESRRKQPRLINCVFPEKSGKNLGTMVLYEYGGPGSRPGPKS